MIIEERMYTLHPGKVPEFLKLTQTEGIKIQQPILGNLYGYFFTEVGTQNQVVHLWYYQSFEDREARRARLAADPGWQAFVPKVRPLILFQETRIMKPVPFFEEPFKKMLEAARN